MNTLADLVVRAQAGDVEAYGRLVQATQTMAYAVALSVVRDSATAQDVAQQAYLRAFRRIGDLQDPATFAGWLRRIVITVALNMRRAVAGRFSAWTRFRTCPSWTKWRRDGPRRSVCVSRGR